MPIFVKYFIIVLSYAFGGTFLMQSWFEPVFVKSFFEMVTGCLIMMTMLFYIYSVGNESFKGIIDEKEKEIENFKTAMFYRDMTIDRLQKEKIKSGAIIGALLKKTKRTYFNKDNNQGNI